MLTTTCRPFGLVLALAMLAASCVNPDARPEAKSQAATPNAATVAARDADSVRQFAIGPDSFTVLVDSSMQHDDTRSIDTLRILDARGLTVFAETLLARRQEPEYFADAAVMRLANADGSVVGAIFVYAVYPSAPGTGEGFRVLAMQSRRLVVLTPRITTGGTPWVLSRSALSSNRQLMPGNQFEMSLSLGHFDATVPMALDLACRPNAPACLRFALRDSIAGLARFSVHAQFQAIEERGSVQLFERPNGASRVTIDVTPGDKVEAMAGAGEVGIDYGTDWYVYLQHPWLQIRLHGRTGWIHGEKDFTTIGLPQAD